MIDASFPHAPLAGVRIVELCRGPMQAAGRLFADLGADVLAVSDGSDAEDADGAVSRETVEAFVLSRGKRVLRVDPQRAADIDRLRTDIAGCDIVIDDGMLSRLGAADLMPDTLAATYPALVVILISAFGRVSPLAGWTANDPVLHALAGNLSRSGIPGRAPLPPPPAIATRSAAAQAVFVGLLAHLRSLETGQGDVLDFSVLDAVAQTVDPGFGPAGSAADGVRASDLPRGRPDVRNQYPIIPCADGFVRLCVLSPRQWRSMFAWMGSPVEFADPSFEKLTVRFGSPALLAAITAFFADRTGAQIEEEAERVGVPAAAVQTFAAATKMEHFRARDLFGTRTFRGIDMALPKSPFEIDGARVVASPEETMSPARGIGTASTAGSVPMRGTGPLNGLRVLDLGVIVVGAETGRLLADAGADVVKVENDGFPDGLRQSKDGSEMSASFAAGHRNKRSLRLDLRSVEGKRRFLAMVARADVLLSNFKPGTLDSLGFDEATLRDVNPALVSIQSSAFGRTGPLSRRLGYGPLVRAATGLSGSWSYPGEDDAFSDAMTVYPDHVAARLGAIASLALLLRRRHSGRGGSASIAQAEVILDHLDVDMAVAALRARDVDVVTCGSEDRVVFACAGYDEWCVVAPDTDERWRAMADLLGVAVDAGGSTGAIDRPALIDVLERWVASRTPSEAMTLLQVAGVPAGMMLRVADMPGFAHYRERGFFREVANPAVAAPFLVEARPVRAAHLPDPDCAPAPLMGQDDAAVLRDWLGNEAEAARDDLHA